MSINLEKDNLQEKYSFSRGYDRGNYCSAYETENGVTYAIKQGYLQMPESDAEEGHIECYVAGFIIGYYASYELHEISEANLDIMWYALWYAEVACLPHNREELEIKVDTTCVSIVSDELRYLYELSL